MAMLFESRMSQLNEAWSHFRRRMPQDALALLEGLGGSATQDEGPSNMLLEIEDDADRARAQIAAKRRRAGPRVPMLPSFETALSGRGDAPMAPGALMSFGHAASAQGMAEEAEPQLLIEG